MSHESLTTFRESRLQPLNGSRANLPEGKMKSENIEKNEESDFETQIFDAN